MGKSPRVDEELLARFGEFVEARLGLHFPRSRLGDLERALVRATRDDAAPDVASFVRGLLAQPPSRAQLERLAAHLTIGETYFFRDEASFECLRSQVLPQLLRLRGGMRRLRAWSAGCSSGEEPYSIAMALSGAIADPAWHLGVLATDISAQPLQKAMRGVYGQWSFRSTPESVKRRFFRPAAGGLEVLPAIKAMVEFAYLNLAEDLFPSLESGTNAMDLIFCRNVLMYFEPMRAQAVLRKLERSLAPGGWLFLGPVEIPQQLPEGLARVHFPGAIVLQKGLEGVREERMAPAAVDRLPAPPPSWRREARPPSRREGPRMRLSASPSAPVAEPHERAADLYRQGRYDDALVLLDQLLSREPDDARAMGLTARVRANQGRLEEARAWCQKAMDCDKLEPAWPYLLATVQLEQEQFHDAASSLRRALFLDPACALAHFMLGNLARRLGRPAEAERHLRNALSALAAHGGDDVLPESEGMTVGRLAQIIEAMLTAEGEAR